MLDHLDASPLDAYIGNIQNVIAASVCKGISIRQQSRSLLTNFYIDSLLERAALELGFPVERHLCSNTQLPFTVMVNSLEKTFCFVVTLSNINTAGALVSMRSIVPF